MDAVVENYESLSSLMEQMSEAAALGQWDRLIELEKQCRARVETMKSADARSVLSEASRLRKAALIKKILADDAAIRSHTQPWMEQLQRVMRTTRQEQQVRRAYAGG
jgi:flagellar protein FliT